MLIIDLIILETELFPSELLQNLEDELLGLISAFASLFLFENHLMDAKVPIEVIEVLVFGTSSAQLLFLVDSFEFSNHFCIHFHLVYLSLDDCVQLQRV